MNFFRSPRAILLLGTVWLFISLLLHDHNLYPSLQPMGVMKLSGLRLMLFAIPLILGWILARQNQTPHWKRPLLWMLWLLFLPYTLYSVTEIRHVAEICRLAPGILFTDGCVDRAWMLLPIFTYAITGVLLFLFTVIQVTTQYIRHSWKKHVVILTLCLYASAASVFGLYTRFNIWDAFVHPEFWISTAWLTHHNTPLWINIFWFWLFSSLSVFFAQRFFVWRSSQRS